METYAGTIEFRYDGRDVRFDYRMDNLGGSPHIYFTDKRGKHHSFFYRASEGVWLYGYNVKISWEIEFAQLMFREFTKHAKAAGFIK